VTARRRHLFVLDSVPGHPLAGFVVEPIDRSGRLLAARGSTDRVPPTWRAFAWADTTGEAPAPPAPPGTLAVYHTVPHPAWDGDLPATWVKQVSFVTRRAELSHDDYRRHHRGHVEVARVHHPGIARYQQDDLVSMEGDGPEPDGFSELWFATEDDLRERFYASDESRLVVRADTSAYIDFDRTFSVMVHGPGWT
jgi:hypothetical protein